MAGRITAFPEVHVLILGTCEYLTSYGRKDLADVIELRAFEMGDYVALVDQPNHEFLLLASRGKCDYRRMVRDMSHSWLCRLGMGVLRQGRQVASEAQEGKETDSPLESPDRNAPLL